VIAGTGRRYLRIGVESLDDVLCGVVDVARFRIAAVVQVNADDGIVVSEYEPDTISVLRLGVFECCLEGIPRRGLSTTRILLSLASPVLSSVYRRVFLPPAHPLLAFA